MAAYGLSLVGSVEQRFCNLPYNQQCDDRSICKLPQGFQQFHVFTPFGFSCAG